MIIHGITRETTDIGCIDVKSKYNTTAWRKLRNRVLSASPFCLLTGDPAECVDHIDGDSTNDHESNLIPLTNSIHNWKTNRFDKDAYTKLSLDIALSIVIGANYGEGIQYPPNLIVCTTTRWAALLLNSRRGGRVTYEFDAMLDDILHARIYKYLALFITYSLDFGINKRTTPSNQ